MKFSLCGGKCLRTWPRINVLRTEGNSEVLEFQCRESRCPACRQSDSQTETVNSGAIDGRMTSSIALLRNHRYGICKQHREAQCFGNKGLVCLVRPNKLTRLGRALTLPLSPNQKKIIKFLSTSVVFITSAYLSTCLLVATLSTLNALRVRVMFFFYFYERRE